MRSIDGTVRRRAVVTVAVVATLMSTAGCSQGEGRRATRDAEQARLDMRQFVQATMDLTDLDWVSDDGPTPIAFECGTDDGKPGVAFSWDQHAAGADNPEQLVNTIGAAWEAKGLTPSYRDAERKDGLTLYSVAAAGAPLRSVSFNASTSRTSIHVDSSCGSGSISEYEQ